MTHDELYTLLPPGLDIPYMRRLTGVPEYWSIHFAVTDMPMEQVATTRVNAGGRTATIDINPAYHFSSRALARTLCHEMMELSTIHTWLTFLRLIFGNENEKLVAEYRTARDAEIEDRLRLIPWFDSWDVAVPRILVDKQGSDSIVYHI